MPRWIDPIVSAVASYFELWGAIYWVCWVQSARKVHRLTTRKVHRLTNHRARLHHRSARNAPPPHSPSHIKKCMKEAETNNGTLDKLYHLHCETHSFICRGFSVKTVQRNTNTINENCMWRPITQTSKFNRLLQTLPKNELHLGCPATQQFSFVHIEAIYARYVYVKRHYLRKIFHEERSMRHTHHGWEYSQA